MKSSRLVLVVLALLMAGLLSPGAPSAVAAETPTPWVRVFASRALLDGDLVWVAAGGFAPYQQLGVVQCDDLPTTDDEGCPVIKTITADGKGRVLTRVRVEDTLIHAGPVGAGFPVYCRADLCRIFLSSVDEEGNQSGPGSRTLAFRGSPATIRVWPSTGLRRKQWVTVTGTAFGAEGRKVGVREHLCYDLVQDTGCFGDLAHVWTRVRSDGTFRAAYLARRFVPTTFFGGRYADCAEDISERFADCSMTAVILDRSGQPDDSFGYAEYFGDPGTLLEFAVP